jgi:hypothetical protein
MMCRLIVVTGDLRSLGYGDVSSYLKSIKGKQGSFTAGTLRG